MGRTGGALQSLQLILLLLSLVHYPSPRSVEATTTTSGPDDELDRPARRPCPLHLSVSIPTEEAELLSDGRLKHASLIYAGSSYWRESNDSWRGCICSLELGAPCLRKCCGPGELVAPSISRYNNCVGSIDELGVQEENDGYGLNLSLPKLQVATELRAGLAPRLDLRDWFSVFAGRSCSDEQMVMPLEPDMYEDDEYELQKNGSLWVKSIGLLPAGRFCMDRQAGRSELATLICVEPEDIKDPQDKQFEKVKRIGYVFSLPFLAVTLLVYAIIPELRNIYGKTLMCYVASLLSAYSSISLSHYIDWSFYCALNEESSMLRKKSSEQCGKDELYNACSSECETTCEDINNDDHSGKHCVSKSDCVGKCTCKSGYVRDNAGGKCIRFQECPRVKH